MGDHGASGVIGAFVVFGSLLIVVVIIALLFAIKAKGAPNVERQASPSKYPRSLLIGRIALAILLIPFALIVAFVLFAEIKASVESRMNAGWEAQRSRSQQH
jgi:hypothetical protein